MESGRGKQFLEFLVTSEFIDLTVVFSLLYFREWTDGYPYKTTVDYEADGLGHVMAAVRRRK